MREQTECWVLDSDGSKVLRTVVHHEGDFVVVIGSDGRPERVRLDRCEFRPNPPQILG